MYDLRLIVDVALYKLVKPSERDAFLKGVETGLILVHRCAFGDDFSVTQVASDTICAINGSLNVPGLKPESLIAHFTKLVPERGWDSIRDAFVGLNYVGSGEHQTLYLDGLRAGFEGALTIMRGYITEIPVFAHAMIHFEGWILEKIDDYDLDKIEY